MARADVDAWLVMAHSNPKQKLVWNMYTPILETVKTALEQKRAVTRIIGLADMDNMIAGVRLAVAQGRRPLVFAVAQDYSRPYDSIAKFKQAKAAGGYLVAYQTEPAYNAARGFNRLTKDDFPALLAATLAKAGAMGADEVWDYARAHTENYPPTAQFPSLSDSFKVRYVPPGYTSKLDVGTDLASNLTQAGHVGYMGAPLLKKIYPRYKAILRDKLVARNDIWSAADLRRFLETFPLQLNIHKGQTCCPPQKWENRLMHLEAFRFAALLANKACVISAPSSTSDMREFKGMVFFAEVAETAAMVKNVSQSLSSCRSQSYSMFKRDFDPTRLLERSGFFSSWLPPHGK